MNVSVVFQRMAALAECVNHACLSSSANILKAIHGYHLFSER